MAQKQKISKIREKINSLTEENELLSLLDGRNRARSVTCGPSSGGMVEITMRSDRATMWYHISPVEAIEFMTQLAASCGVEAAFRPRQDFAAWRSWDTSMPINSNWIGTAPWQLPIQDTKVLAIAAAEYEATKAQAEAQIAAQEEDPEEAPAVSKKPGRRTKGSTNPEKNGSSRTRKQ